MSNATVKPEPKERMSEKKIIQTAEDLDAMINAGGENRTARSGYKGNDLKPTDFRVVLPEEFSEQLIVKRSIKRAGEQGFKAKKFYPVFDLCKMKRQPSMQTGILWKSSNISTRDISSLREPIHLPKHTKKLWAGSPDTMTSCANYAT